MRESPVKEALEKGLMTTLGAWLLVHEKASEIIDEMIEKGKMAPREGRTYLDELSRKVDKEKEEIKSRLSGGMKSTLGTAGLATKDDIEELKIRLDQLEGAISVLESKLALKGKNLKGKKKEKKK